MKKFFLSFLTMLMVATAFITTDVQAATSKYHYSKVVNRALNKVGSWYRSGYCLAFVKEQFRDSYGFTSTQCCAFSYGSGHIDSKDRNNIPLGASVFFAGSQKTCSSCGNRCGHVGIYVGNDQVVHAWGSGEIRKDDIDYITRSHPYRGWGFHGDVQLTGYKEGDDVAPQPKPTPTPTPAPEYTVPTKDLYYKAGETMMSGSDVAWVQRALKALNYNVEIDRVFGPSAEKAIRKFQEHMGIDIDGRVGPQTLAKLKERYARKDEPYVIGVTLASKPKKKVYKMGEKLSTDGLTFKLTYNKGKASTTSKGFTTTGFDSSTLGRKTVNVKYKNKTYTFTVDIEHDVRKADGKLYLYEDGKKVIKNTLCKTGGVWKPVRDGVVEQKLSYTNADVFSIMSANSLVLAIQN